MLWSCTVNFTRELTSAIPLLTFQSRIPHYALVGCSSQTALCILSTCLQDKTQRYLPIRYPGNSVLPKDLFFLSSLHPAKLGLATSIPDSTAQQTANPVLFSKVCLHYNRMLLWNRYLIPGLGASYGVCATHRLVEPKIQPFSMQEIKSTVIPGPYMLSFCPISWHLDIIPQRTRDHLSPYKWGTGTHLLPSTILIPSKFSNSSKSCCDCCL